MAERTASHRVYAHRGVTPPETSEITETVRAMRRAPTDQRREFWEAMREAIVEECEETAPPFRPTLPAPSLVYYVRFGDRVKIGYTTNLAVRLRSLPHDEVLATEPGTMRDERARHAEFADLRITGEWFRFEEPLVSHIAGLS